MSSHHVVRTNQEPALLIADTQADPVTPVQQLLEWSPTVIVLEDALEKVLTWGIKFDVLICGYERVKMHAAALTDHAPLKILSHLESESPLHTAIMFLQAARCRSVAILGVSPERLTLPFSGLNIVAFYDGMRWSLICTGCYEKWLKEGTPLRFISAGKLTKEGLVNDVVPKPGLVKITGTKPFWVGEPYT